jgi:hypothetical protein
LDGIDQFSIDEAADEAFAVGFGDVDVHEVATGRVPDADLAFKRRSGLRPPWPQAPATSLSGGRSRTPRRG